MYRAKAVPEKRSGRRLLEVILVILLLVVGTSLLMPSLNRARELAKQSVMDRRSYHDENIPQAIMGEEDSTVSRPLAQIKSFVATIDLTPTLSIGTTKPESIYEANFNAQLKARNPSASKGECEIRLPLPPQLISLSDLNVSVAGEPSENVFVRDGNLVWHGRLDVGKSIPLEIQYKAVGKGIYTLHTPPGKIVDTFEATLTANSSDLQMMELSLQPDNPRRENGKTVYEWKYKRLMIGRPIAIDILGIAPMDRLGELVWLGPVSVLVFTLLVAMLTLAYRPEMLDKWMLLLIGGTFAAGYPLMYFAQEFMSLMTTIIAACLAVIVIIAIRAVTLFGLRMGIAGVVSISAAVFALTMGATIYPKTQGILLTVGAIGTLVVMMILMPKAQKALADMLPTTTAKPQTPPLPQEKD